MLCTASVGLRMCINCAVSIAQCLHKISSGGYQKIYQRAVDKLMASADEEEWLFVPLCG